MEDRFYYTLKEEGGGDLIQKSGFIQKPVDRIEDSFDKAALILLRGGGEKTSQGERLLYKIMLFNWNKP